MEESQEDPEDKKRRVKSVKLILFNVFIERFCSGGILAIIVTFCVESLTLDSNLANSIYHMSDFVLYFSAIFGAIIADSWLGLFKTISLLNSLMLMGSGMIIVILTSSEIFHSSNLSLIGLLLIFLASGGTKTNQNVFGANQFKLPEQEAKLNTFFSIQYFTIKCGLLAGQTIIPVLKNDVACFGMENCYPLAFGVPTVLMLVAVITFLSGKSFYVHVPPNDNMFVKVCGCILTAFEEKFKRAKKESKDHWLDFAEEKSGEKLVAETKTVLNVLKVFMTLPIYSAVYSQNSSRFVLQAAKLNGELGFYTIKSDQMVMSVTVFILVMVPIFDYIVYPILAKFGIKTPLHKIACGFVTATTSLLIAAFIEWKIKEDPIHILWLLPQYFFIAISDIFVWVSVINFAYKEAPTRMKSVLSSFIFIAFAAGSLINIVVSSLNLIESQIDEFLLYSCAMISNLFLFILLSKN